ncbi:uncharacterized protein [Clytia hemisphaerica]|uniref:RRM domain-containing protein n=1 Tax=Clytia hemisphaerica TaxID=252671 RepID=A0A7M5X487_9CNID
MVPMTFLFPPHTWQTQVLDSCGGFNGQRKKSYSTNTLTRADSTEEENECKTYEGITLCVYRLEPEITKEQLKEVFSKFGHVLKCTVTEECSGPLPYRIGSIAYYSPLEAQQAIRYMNGKAIIQNNIYVGLQTRKKERRRSSRTSPPPSALLLPPPKEGVEIENRTERSFSESVTTSGSGGQSVGEKLIQFKRLCRTRSLNTSALDTHS